MSKKRSDPVVDESDPTRPTYIVTAYHPKHSPRADSEALVVTLQSITGANGTLTLFLRDYRGWISELRLSRAEANLLRMHVRCEDAVADGGAV